MATGRKGEHSLFLRCDEERDGRPVWLPQLDDLHLALALLLSHLLFMFSLFGLFCLSLKVCYRAMWPTSCDRRMLRIHS